MNIAQFLQTFMGVARGDMAKKQAHGSRTTEQKRAGAFGRGLHNNITRKNAAAYAAKAAA